MHTLMKFWEKQWEKNRELKIKNIFQYWEVGIQLKKKKKHFFPLKLYLILHLLF